MKKAIILSLAVIFCAIGNASAQKYEYRIKSGVNIGGTLPLPLPAQIRKITGYSPALSLMLGGDVVRHINSRWGVQTGVKFETKGMTARAQVKGYQISMTISDGDTSGAVEGVFTGKVKTEVKNAYLSFPFLAVYNLTPRWSLDGGVFLSVLLNGDFGGEAYDGYIREGSPVGEKVGVSSATFSFSDDIRTLNWGGQFGARWRAYRQFSVFGDMTWAANSIFKRDFTGINFDMYNVYFNVGFAYTF